MTPPQREQRSLFSEILDWMLTPLLLLWPISLVMTWLVAQGVAGKPFDRALEYNVGELARLVVVKNRQVQFNLPLPARGGVSQESFQGNNPGRARWRCGSALFRSSCAGGGCRPRSRCC